MSNKKKCAVDVCENQYFAKGFCRSHYMQVRKHGDIVQDVVKRSNTCLADGCQMAANAGFGYCSKHYYRFKKYGDYSVSQRNINKNEYVCIDSDTVGIIVRNLDKVHVGTIIIDKKDIEKAKNHKWYIGTSGYPTTHLGKDRIKYLHNVIFPEINRADHINRNKLDNRSCNIRESSEKENSWNRSLSTKNNSGFIGVYKRKGTGKWSAQIVADGLHSHLGVYTLKEDAVRARLIAEKKYFGEFAPQQHLYEKYGI